MPECLSFHTILVQVTPQRILFYQTLLRQGVLASMEALIVLEEHLTEQPLSKEFIQAKNVSCFSLSNCLLDNPSGIDDDFDATLEIMQNTEFLQLLRQTDILVKGKEYILKQGKKESLFDHAHVGNFHQQIGSFLLSKREDVEKWWIYQKFESDFSLPRNTPYRWVQHQFMEEYFNGDLSGQNWLDFGCGIGYYSGFFSRKNANVLGVDPSVFYIDIARKYFSNEGRVQYLAHQFEKKTDFQIFESKQFDRIFLSDVFLYYFVPYKPLQLTAVDLLEALRQYLHPNGRIYILDPHGFFHLQSWLGTDSPFLICTEYKHKKYRVTPTLEDVSKAVEDAGLLIRKVRELTSHKSLTTNEQSRNVTCEFPLWWFFELSPI